MSWVWGFSVLTKSLCFASTKFLVSSTWWRYAFCKPSRQDKSRFVLFGILWRFPVLTDNTHIDTTKFLFHPPAHNWSNWCPWALQLDSMNKASFWNSLALGFLNNFGVGLVNGKYMHITRCSTVASGDLVKASDSQLGLFPCMVKSRS